MTTPRRPVVFIHGLFLHASSWGPWLDLLPGGWLRTHGAGPAERTRNRPGGATGAGRGREQYRDSTAVTELHQFKGRVRPIANQRCAPRTCQGC